MESKDKKPEKSFYWTSDYKILEVFLLFFVMIMHIWKLQVLHFVSLFSKIH